VLTLLAACAGSGSEVTVDAPSLTTATSITARTRPTTATTSARAATTSTAGVTTSATTARAAGADNEVGDTASTGDLDVTLNSVVDPFVATNEFAKADPGRRYVAVDLSILNQGKETVAFSTLLYTEMIDSLGQSWNVSLFAGAGATPSIDGEIPPGETRRGTIVFDVPQDATGLTLRVKGSFTAEGATWAVS
jgi:Domain of unknown function (DUF4352)